MRHKLSVSLVLAAGLIAGCQGSGATTGGGDAGDTAGDGARKPASPVIEEPVPSTRPDGALASPASPVIEIERDVAPDFDTRALDGAARVKLSDFRGKVVLLSFWGID